MSTTGFKDRKPGLIVFGLLEIAIGLVYVLSIAALLVPAMAQSVPDAAMAIAILAAMAIISIWLGVGTVMARRWARTLSVLIAWGWLGAGVLVLAYGLIAQELIADATGGFVFITLVAGAFVLFYSGKNVKATFEARDPKQRWTDRCPLPVLALSLGYALIAVSALVGFYAHSPVPFFGTVLTGLGSQAYHLLQLVLAAYLAWGTYRLAGHAWMVSVIVTVVLGISALVSYATIDMTTLYRAMNVPIDQIAHMRAQGWDSVRIATITGVLTLAWLAFLAYVKKYFRAASPAHAG